MVGIWYLFFWIDLLRTLESNATTIDWSFITVNTIGDMKFSSEQLENFSMCPFCSRRSNSTEIYLGGSRRPFGCFAVIFWWNFDLITCVLDRPILKVRLGKCDTIVCFTLHLELSILLTLLPLFTCCCTTANPRLPKMSLPMMSLCPSSTTVRQASLQIQ